MYSVKSTFDTTCHRAAASKDIGIENRQRFGKGCTVMKKSVFVKHLALCCLLAVLLCLGVSAASAERLMLPAGTKTVGIEAFYGDTSLDEVVLPEGVTTIRDRAFANSGLQRINLPASITSIADNAFENTYPNFTVAPGSYAAKWCTSHGFIADIKTLAGFYKYVNA